MVRRSSICAARSAGSRLIFAIEDEPSSLKPSSPSTVSVTVVLRTWSSVKRASKRRMKGPTVAAALLSLALASSSAERPSTSRRLTSLPSVAPTIAPVRGDDHHDLRLGVVPGRARMKPGVEAGADRGHRRGLGEDLGVRPDADLEILAPGALRDQHLLEMHRLGRAGLELGQIVADELADLLADRRGRGRVAARLLLDDALQHRDGEGDARRLHGLQIERREQPGLCADRAHPRACSPGSPRANRRPRPEPAAAPPRGRAPRRGRGSWGRRARRRPTARRARVTTAGPSTSGRQTRPSKAASAASRGRVAVTDRERLDMGMIRYGEFRGAGRTAAFRANAQAIAEDRAGCDTVIDLSLKCRPGFMLACAPTTRAARASPGRKGEGTMTFKSQLRDLRPRPSRSPERRPRWRRPKSSGGTR